MNSTKASGTTGWQGSLALDEGVAVGLNRAWEEENGVVTAIGSEGSARTPRDGFVVSARGAASSALSILRPGDTMALAMEVSDARGSPFDLRGCDFTSAEPMVAGEGGVVREYPSESYREGFEVERHPGAVVGRSADGRTVNLFLVDGRQPGHGVGATLGELAKLLPAEGAAMVHNLDGGGSSAMVLPGLGLLNSPSDGTERRRCDPLLVQPAFAPSGLGHSGRTRTLPHREGGP